MGRMQREKGKRGEREASQAIQQHLGVAARRGQQYCGSPDSPDVITAIDGVAIEVKRCETVSIHRWMDKAVADSPGDVPVIIHRKNNTDWLVTLRLGDVNGFYKRLLAAQTPTHPQGVGDEALPPDLPCKGVPTGT